MRIYAFTSFYPSLYKPYYDTQFVDLVQQGHDLTILASGMLGSRVTEKVQKYGLMERTCYYPPDQLRAVFARAPELITRLLGGGLERALAAAAGPNGVKARVKAGARALILPQEAPDLCIVHSHETLRLVQWLRRVYPDCTVAVYYYGGTPPEAGRSSTFDPFQGADVIFACSRFAGREAKELGADPERVHILPLSFDLDDFQPLEPRPYSDRGEVQLLSVGRLSHGKGYGDALEAIQMVLDRYPRTSIHYTIVGSGVRRKALEGLVSAAELEDRVTFAGALDNREVVRLCGEADALVLPSFSTPGWTETQGTVVQEAMLMEALVITTRTGGVPDSVPPWMKPYQVPERQPRALAEAIQAVAQMTPQEMQEMGKRNRMWVRQRFNIRDFNRTLLTTALSTAHRK